MCHKSLVLLDLSENWGGAPAQRVLHPNFRTTLLICHWNATRQVVLALHSLAQSHLMLRDRNYNMNIQSVLVKEYVNFS
ncbi:MAG: hypothetical protein VKJ64_15000 [Leptolyngbyaceae bacterium]|nr:hypothetical protein [Leptolyngbyaceae bacterium]